VRRALSTLLTLALLGGSWAVWRAHVRLGASAVPTFAVTKTTFARQVTAEGNLRAVTRTPVTVPQIDGMWGALTIAWLAHDGTTVHAGDVVVRFDRVAAETALREAESTLAMAEA
jgi:multidrug efflux pump subunit AcrA (membrane-fusion protein)